MEGEGVAMPWKPDYAEQSKPFTIMGESLDSWKEILRDWGLRAVVGLLCGGLFLGALYGIVRFVKWAWEQ